MWLFFFAFSIRLKSSSQSDTSRSTGATSSEPIAFNTRKRLLGTSLPLGAAGTSLLSSSCPALRAAPGVSDAASGVPGAGCSLSLASSKSKSSSAHFFRLWEWSRTSSKVIFFTRGPSNSRGQPVSTTKEYCNSVSLGTRKLLRISSSPTTFLAISCGKVPLKFFFGTSQKSVVNLAACWCSTFLELMMESTISGRGREVICRASW